MDSFSSHLLYSVLDVFFCSWYSSMAHICSLTSAWRSYTRAFSGFFWVHSDLRCSCCWESPISGSFHGLWCSWHHWWIHCSKRWLVYPSFRPKLDSLEISRSMKEFHEGWNPWRDSFGLIVRVECHLISKSKFPGPRKAMIERLDACVVPQIAGSVPYWNCYVSLGNYTTESIWQRSRRLW